MNKRQRLQATLAGEPVDRPAVALWRHWPGDDQRAADLATAHLAWQHTWDFDLVKMMPSSEYCLYDWGVQSAWLGGDEGTRTYQNCLINAPEDWQRLWVLDPLSGALGDARRACQIVKAAVGEDTPVLMTIFGPLAQAKNLAGPNLLAHLRRQPETLLAGLEIITQSILRYVESLRDLGIDGIYYAVQLASTDKLSRAEVERFGRPFDLRILEAANGWWFNMLHLHGLDVYADLFADYPVQAVNWHDRESGPSLSEGISLFSGAVSGGLNRWTMLRGAPTDVRREAADAFAQTGGRRLILSSGCVVMTTTPQSNLRAARESVESGK
jgi:uroporphyrinogen decarboxylase